MAKLDLAYHQDALEQARIAFLAAVIAGVLGALVILAGTVKLLFFAGEQAGVQAGTLTAASGVVTESLAALLFMLADRANRRLDRIFNHTPPDRGIVDSALCRRTDSQEGGLTTTTTPWRSWGSRG